MAGNKAELKLENSLTAGKGHVALGAQPRALWLFQGPGNKPWSAQACQGSAPATQGAGKTGISPCQAPPAPI